MIENYKYSEITNLIIRTFYNVYNNLGYGFLEKFYENAMIIELRKLGLKCTKQHPISVYYDNTIVGEYFADIIAENCVILELKAAENFCDEYECQLVNYLKTSDIEIGLLLNFGKKPEFKRKVLTSEFKNHKVS